MGKLTHYISPNALRSIIQGTVAYDYKQRTITTADCYSLNYPGTYVVSLGTDGRQGEFLDHVEMVNLASKLNAYADASEVWLKGPERWDATSLASRIARQVVRDIEMIYVDIDDSDPPRYGARDTKVTNIRLFAEWMQKRADTMIDEDPLGTTRLQQAPIMVGCCKRPFSERLRVHDPPTVPNKSGLKEITYTWALLISAIKDMGLNPDIVKLPVFVY